MKKKIIPYMWKLIINLCNPHASFFNLTFRNENPLNAVINSLTAPEMHVFLFQPRNYKSQPRKKWETTRTWLKKLLIYFAKLIILHSHRLPLFPDFRASHQPTNQPSTSLNNNRSIVVVRIRKQFVCILLVCCAFLSSSSFILLSILNFL